jgi:hypothetical protein
MTWPFGHSGRSRRSYSFLFALGTPPFDFLYKSNKGLPEPQLKIIEKKACHGIMATTIKRAAVRARGSRT